jgi:ABC-type branched-subunit amino acid transport system substrate-binding protein
MPVIASGGAAQSSEVIGKLKDNLRLLQPVVVVAEWEGNQQFHTRLHNAVQNRTVNDRSTVAHAYDAVVALLKACAAAPPPKSGMQIQEQIPKQRFEGELV